MTRGELPPELELLLRELAPQVLGVLARRCGDFGAAEDAVQEALLAAATTWPDEGLPDNPRGWLLRVAQRRLIDAIRAEAARRRREEAVFEREVPGADPPAGDDTLAMYVLCCHPALPEAAAVALTLRAVGGLDTRAIAAAFLVPEATMAQRIARAKKRLAGLGEPFARPDRAAWRERLPPVLRVLYLIFTEGHTASAGGALHRPDLAAEAVRLTRALHRLLPDDPEVTGLLALLLLTDARRGARTGPHGELIPLAEQDRGRWDRAMIGEGVRLATAAVGAGLTGPYRIQAAVAALHAQALRVAETDWAGILALYTLLERQASNPVVTLNRAVAVAMVHGPAAGLAATEGLEPAFATGHRLDAVRGHLHELAGDTARAVAHYDAAAAASTSTPERDYLTLRAARLRHGHTAGP
ncbi:RNA polymerase sigma factor [Nocardia sp. NPDC057353]|uniref:RNA polymerase sigma factor n=1 Tax=Nocardia sp. NPDC057353 TaxID=3346104 RepID=UPI003639B9E6